MTKQHLNKVQLYQKDAKRTKCPQLPATNRLHKYPGMVHAVLGMTSEVGELASAVEKYAWYDRDLDHSNVIEEIGDVMWYIAELCDSLGLDLSTCMDLNIAKLKARYPEKYQHDLSMNRDKQKEMEFMIASDDGVNYEKT